MKFNTFNTYTTKIIAVILSFVLGILVVVGAEAGVAYYFLTKEGTMKQIEETAQNNGINVDFGEEIENATLLNWGKELLSTVSNLSSNKIGDIEKLLGMAVISDNLNSLLGVDKEVIKAANLDNLGESISSNLTMSIAKEKFGIEFPDMPLFSDEEFLSKTLDTAFEDLAEQPLSKVLTIDENSNAALQSLKDIPINQLGQAAGDEAISKNCMFEFLDINENSSKTMQAIKYCTLKSYYEYEADGTTIKTDAEGNKIYQTKTITETVDGVAVEKTIPLMGVSDKMEILKVAEVIDINEDSNAVLRKMRKAVGEEDPGIFGNEDMLVNDLGGEKFNALVDNTKIGEIIDIYENDIYEEGNLIHSKSEPIMIALQDTAISGLNEKIKDIKLKEIFDENNLTSGALSLIDAETEIDAIPQAMTDAVLQCTIITLKEKGLINTDSLDNNDMDNMKMPQRSFIYNSTLSGVIKGLVGFVSDVQNIDLGNLPGLPSALTSAYGKISFSNVTLSNNSYSSLKDFVDEVNNDSLYSNITAGTTVSITIDEAADAEFYNEDTDTYFIPVFNLETNTTFDFGGSNVKMAVMDKVTENGVNTYTISKYQFAFYFGQSEESGINVYDETTFVYAQEQ